MDNILFTDRIELQTDFSYTDLYNASRGAVFKDEDISLLNYAIDNKIVMVEKYMVAKDIQRETLLDIVDSKEKTINFLIAKMKDYHQENEHVLSPFIYVLNLINSDFVKNCKIEIEQDVTNDIRVGYRFENSNAFTRIFINTSRIAINSTNDDIENLLDTLCIRDIDLYIINLEKQYHEYQDIVAYRVISQPLLNELREKIRDDFRMKISGLQNSY